jgi:hypothetical protein
MKTIPIHLIHHLAMTLPGQRVFWANSDLPVRLLLELIVSLCQLLTAGRNVHTLSHCLYHLLRQRLVALSVESWFPISLFLPLSAYHCLPNWHALSTPVPPCA